MEIALIVLGVLLVFGVIPVMLMSWFIYSALLVRTSGDKWQRGCSMPDEEICVRMYEEGLRWHETHAAAKIPVSAVSDGFSLAGEYFDFGAEKAVLIIAGRTETCPYSYYFAKPYADSGYNVLVIDNRGHGLSEGKYTSLGFREYRDILAWGRELHEHHGVNHIVLHGICIGASTGLFALTASNCPAYFEGLVAEGMYARFYDSFNNHMKLDHHPIFPFSMAVMLWSFLMTGAHPMTQGPITRIGKLTKPALFLHSREDLFSTPERSQQVYDRCTAPHKVVWFDHGAHSQIRIHNSEAYDEAVEEFLKSL